MTVASKAKAAGTELFRARTVLIMLLVGVLAFAGLVVLSVYAPTLRSGDNGGGHALSKSAIGYAGAAAFFKARGERVVVSRGTGTYAEDGLMIITPTLHHDERALNAIRYDGVKLIVLPKWAAGPHMTHKGWVMQAEPFDEQSISEGLLKPYGKKLVVQRRTGVSRPQMGWIDGGGSDPLPTPGGVDRFQTLKGPGLTPIILDDRGGVVLAQVPDENIYVLSDPDLLNTQGLKSLDTARTADALIDGLNYEDGPLLFDVTLHGFKRARDLLAMSLEPPFLGGTLCAVAAALLAGLGAAVRFGPTRVAQAPYAMGKEALVDNTAGLIRMAKREHRMADGYARLCRDLAVRAVGAPRQLEEAELDQFLDRLGTQRGTASTFSDLIRDARTAGDIASLMAVARKLYDWRLEMTRESR